MSPHGSIIGITRLPPSLTEDGYNNLKDFGKPLVSVVFRGPYMWNCSIAVANLFGWHPTS